MDVPGPDNDWRSQGFRQKVVTQIEDAMRKAGTAHTKSSTDMESHVLTKAKSREEYLSMVARLIIHFRDIHKKKHEEEQIMYTRIIPLKDKDDDEETTSAVTEVDNAGRSTELPAKELYKVHLQKQIRKSDMEMDFIQLQMEEKRLSIKKATLEIELLEHRLKEIRK
ncbi:uncharacterized protein Hap1MRO34_021266 isoform 1-T1 [Clarias gariepinus]